MGRVSLLGPLSKSKFPGLGALKDENPPMGNLEDCARGLYPRSLLGQVSWERQQAIKSKVREILRL